MPNILEVRELEGDIPPIRRGQVDWVQTVEPLKASPGKWFFLKEFTSASNAHATRCQLQNGRRKTPAGKFLFAVREIYPEDGSKKWNLYGRFEG